MKFQFEYFVFQHVRALTLPKYEKKKKEKINKKRKKRREKKKKKYFKSLKQESICNESKRKAILLKAKILYECHSTKQKSFKI